MATAPPVPIQWIPDDDLLLKNAVEAGASLEALAKGAIEFSRKFTLQELRDRWHSLLYDPVISVKSSSEMFELEISGANSSSKLTRSESIKGNKEVPMKRKSDSIRSKYYAMRKKLRSEFLSSTDIGFFVPDPQSIEFQDPVRLDGNPSVGNCMLGDSMSDILDLQEEDLDFLRIAFQETLPQPECPNSFEVNHPDAMIGSYSFGESASSSLLQGGINSLEPNAENGIIPPPTSAEDALNENSHISSLGLEDKHTIDPLISEEFASLQSSMYASGQPHLNPWRAMLESALTPEPVDMGDAAQVAEGILHDIEGKENTSEFADPDSLLNFSIEDGILLVGVEDTKDESCINDTSPAVVDSLKEDDVAKVVAERTLPETSSVHSPCPNSIALEAVEPSTEQQINVPPEAHLLIKSASDADCAESYAERIWCTLNTEDPEIPCNDDIFLLIHPSPVFGHCTTELNNKVSVGPSNADLEKDNPQGISFHAEPKEPVTTFAWQTIKAPGLLESHPVNPFVGRAAETELHDSGLGFSNTITTDFSKGNSLYPVTKFSSERLVEKDIAGCSSRVGHSSATLLEVSRPIDAGSGRIVPAEAVVRSPVYDQEEAQMDDEVPYFSDVEAMVLEMDLDPYDKDSQATRQGPIYQDDNTKKTVIRLEQGARSYLERAMTLRNAFAILYGRNMRHYITKPEVLIGRSTEDFDVDIDLAKEGRANKISRRQATIKMESDGSFVLKNLGKRPVWVNGMSIAPGQLLTLNSSCLIEIKGMSFVFEINQRYVNKQLGTIFKKETVKTGKSKRTAQGKVNRN